MPRQISSVPVSIEEDLRQQLFALLQKTGGNPSQLLDLLYMIIENRAWEKLNLSFLEFVSLPYHAGGAGWSVDNVRAVLRMKHGFEDIDPEVTAKMNRLRRELDDLLIPVAAPHGGHKNQHGQQVAVVTSAARRGNSRADTLSRLKRDRPDLARRVLDGELTSNQAAILAGFRTRSIQFYPADVQRTAHAIRRHMSAEQIKALLEKLQENCD